MNHNQKGFLWPLRIQPRWGLAVCTGAWGSHLILKSWKLEGKYSWSFSWFGFWSNEREVQKPSTAILLFFFCLLKEERLLLTLFTSSFSIYPWDYLCGFVPKNKIFRNFMLTSKNIAGNRAGALIQFYSDCTLQIKVICTLMGSC